MTDKPFIDKLQEAFPAVYPGEYHAMALDCPQGWERILWEFSQKLSNYLAETGAEAFVVDVREKYARMEVTLSGKDKRRPRRQEKCGQCEAKLALRDKFCPQCGTEVETHDDCHGAHIEALVKDVEERSQETCQVCGAPGLWHEVNHWEYTLCPNHFMLKEFGHESLFYKAVGLLRGVPSDDDGDCLLMADWREQVSTLLAEVEDHDRRWIPDHGLVEE